MPPLVPFPLVPEKPAAAKLSIRYYIRLSRITSKMVPVGCRNPASVGKGCLCLEPKKKDSYVDSFSANKSTNISPKHGVSKPCFLRLAGDILPQSQILHEQNRYSQ